MEGDALLVLAGPKSAYDLARAALSRNSSLETTIESTQTDETLDYNSVYNGNSEWKLLPSFDHPDETARCLVTGTGLTHKASAQNRQAMHEAAAQKSGTPRSQAEQTLTDSMRMYRSGLEGGRPAPGKIGASPEWFYKGCGTILRAHGEPLEVPSFALDGGEEAEVAGVYIIDDEGKPRRVGFTLANEFSDHEFEEKNYLYLAHSKLRTCSIGPELIIGSDFQSAHGKVRLWRGAKVYWSTDFATGEANMSHTIANLEHHHFKYPAHRRAGDAHVYFFGADAFSFGEQIKLQDGDVMELELDGFGRPLKNPITIDRTPHRLVTVDPI